MQRAYLISLHSPHTPTLMAHAHVLTFFNTQKIKNPINRLQFKKAQYHDDLVREYFIYACEILIPLLCEGITTSWTEKYHCANLQEWRTHDAYKKHSLYTLL